MTDKQKLRELLAKTINHAYLLGQEYWRLADSESYSDNRRSDDTQSKFDALLSETISVVGAQASIAQDEIDRLSAALAAKEGEIERLREGLRVAVDHGAMTGDEWAQDIVHAALAPSQPQGEHSE